RPGCSGLRSPGPKSGAFLLEPWALERDDLGTSARAGCARRDSRRHLGQATNRYGSLKQKFCVRRLGRDRLHHSTKDIAQVTALGATASRIATVSTRPNKQNRSARSSMPLPVRLAPRPTWHCLYPSRRARCMNQFTERRRPCRRPSSRSRIGEEFFYLKEGGGPQVQKIEGVSRVVRTALHSGP